MANQRQFRGQMGELENKIDSRRQYYASHIMSQEKARAHDREQLIDQRVM